MAGRQRIVGVVAVIIVVLVGMVAVWKVAFRPDPCTDHESILVTWSSSVEAPLARASTFKIPPGEHVLRLDAEIRHDELDFFLSSGSVWAVRVGTDPIAALRMVGRTRDPATTTAATTTSSVSAQAPSTAPEAPLTSAPATTTGVLSTGRVRPTDPAGAVVFLGSGREAINERVTLRGGAWYLDGDDDVVKVTMRSCHE